MLFQLYTGFVALILLLPFTSLLVHVWFILIQPFVALHCPKHADSPLKICSLTEFFLGWGAGTRCLTVTSQWQSSVKQIKHSLPHQQKISNSFLIISVCCDDRPLPLGLVPSTSWSMKLRVQGQKEDQRGPGERLSERTVKLVNWTKRMPWIVVNGGRW